MSNIDPMLAALLFGGGGSGGSGRAEWGYIQGVLEAQTDLINFVNSTAVSQAAHYIYKTDSQGNKIPFDSLEELEAYAGTVTPNDYANVLSTDSVGNTYYDRYLAVETESGVEWSLSFRINNTTFTAAQWGALNSGITLALAQRIAQTILGVAVNGTELTPDANWKVNIPLAGSSKFGVIKTNPNYATSMSGENFIAQTKTYAQYEAMGNGGFVGKGTLENVFTKKGLIDANYSTLTLYEVGSTTPVSFKIYAEEA